MSIKKFWGIIWVPTLITTIIVLLSTYLGFTNYYYIDHRILAQTDQTTSSNQTSTSNASNQPEITRVNKTIIPAQQTTVKANQTVIPASNNQTE
jgi:hypothetical protein